MIGRRCYFQKEPEVGCFGTIEKVDPSNTVIIVSGDDGYLYELNVFDVIIL